MTGRTPTEPTGPSTLRDAFRPRWVVGWLVLAGILLVVLGVTWFGGAGVEVLGLIGVAAALAVAVALHHVVVTQDAGERAHARPDTSGIDVPVLVKRRHLIGGGLAVLVGGLLALFGLQRFAPTPPPGSDWTAGSPLVTLAGARLQPADVPLGGVVTVWPEGFEGTERAAVMLIRLRELPEPPTRLDGVVDETLIAYSRLCTHAGCAVALYRDVDQALFCPCHQATFDARRAATPTAGPASTPLPQLPLGIAPEGHLIATGDLTARPGPVGGTVDV
jgi:ubiquinol-cytochrome c reductase iron-sulfur subunit